MTEDFIVIIPNEAIRKFTQTEGGYSVYIWEGRWVRRGSISEALAQWYFNINETYVKSKKEVCDVFRKRLIAYISLLDDYNITRENEKWQVSTDWLVGCISGRVFVSSDLDTAMDEMILYFDRHIDNETIVGEVLRESGWPDIDKVKAYLKARGSEE